CEKEPERPSTVVGQIEEVASVNGTKQITPELVSQTRDVQPKKLRHRLAGDLDNIVLMALHKEPARRYASVEQFYEDICRHLDGQPIIARKDRLWYRAEKLIKRNKTAVIAATLSTLMVLAFVVGLNLLARRDKAVGKTIDSIAVLPLENLSGDPTQDYFADGV